MHDQLPDSLIPQQSISIGYVMRSFPMITQATVVNEMKTLQQLGYPIHVFSLLRPDAHEYREEPTWSLPPVTYCWETRAPRSAVIRANLSILGRIGPTTYFRAFDLARRGGILTNLAAFQRLAHHAYTLKQAGVTHFHAHWATEATTVALIFSWLTGIPFGFTAHAYDIFLSPQFLDLKVREASFAVTVSQYNKQYIVDHFAPDHREKIHVIYPLIDLAQFSLRTPLGDTPTILLSVARLTEYKGLIYLVEACRILKERGLSFVCQIVGQGEDRPLLEEAIQRYGLESYVHLLGALPHHAIPSLMDQATVFVLPCVIARNGDRDGMPLVLIEAMGRGVPVVSSDVIGLPELVRNGAGLLSPPGDPEALASAIERIIQLSPAARDEMGQAGRRIVEEFDARKGTQRLLDLIRAGQPHRQREVVRTR